MQFFSKRVDMMNKTELLDFITDHFLNSGDFNGIPNYSMPSFNVNDLISLINEQEVFIISEHDDINIHINRENHFADIAKQADYVLSDVEYAIYPSCKHLSSVSIKEEKPFTKMIALGAAQYSIVYFVVDALDVYVNNPQYTIWDFGYRGSIYISDDESFDEDNLHNEYIKDFGIAYPSEGERDSDRAIGVFLRDLAKLNYEGQCKWRAFMIKNQSSFIINSGFAGNLLYGEWVDSYWVFDALLDEIMLINDMCSSIGLPSLFNNEYLKENKELLGYRILLIPSLRNYYEFVSALEKICINNINYRFFLREALVIRPVERKKEDGSLKGSIEMLDEWFKNNYFSNNTLGYQIFNESITCVFREIRRIRQIPAHELYNNRYDKKLYKQQNDLIRKTYFAINCLRNILNRHPLARSVLIPEKLQSIDKIVIF